MVLNRIMVGVRFPEVRSGVFLSGLASEWDSAPVVRQKLFAGAGGLLVLLPGGYKGLCSLAGPCRPFKVRG